MSQNKHDVEKEGALGVVAIGAPEAAAYRRAQVEVWELADAWAWMASAEAARNLSRQEALAELDAPMDPLLSAWAMGRTIVVPMPAGASGKQKAAIETLARALRVQTGAQKITLMKWGK